ncbi:hypothetical protein VT84_37550 [Gemmata sp. SH-PL17]|uniref:hypothetical protein n=1 Tax=Gemmata sp. SH-PL17 TaxID=1630693 RepID=UPI00078BCEBE|nr:hypothetical protein [Gemmata sp. SH-PL17]AMV30159.1 hypothetical protein VT84_37550 [Gemmata sp. SH-PL17]
MGYGTVSRPGTVCGQLAGLVTALDWEDRLPGYEQWLAAHPGSTMLLECEGVTGFEFPALASLVRFCLSAPGRVRLLNWRAEFVQAALSQVHGELPTGPRVTRTPTQVMVWAHELELLAERLTAQIAELRQLRSRR